MRSKPQRQCCQRQCRIHCRRIGKHCVRTDEQIFNPVYGQTRTPGPFMIRTGRAKVSAIYPDGAHFERPMHVRLLRRC
mgnify:CR=1 FL=1